ncbi:MAG: class I SAM-dependent methyltransferase [Balneolaceae bacterium]
MSDQDREHAAPEYTLLAPLYDTLMHDVDYELWADFIDGIIQDYCPDASDLLELACGTGSVALLLDELECYRILATDQSSEMVSKARAKRTGMEYDITFQQMDATRFDLNKRFDVIYMLFDSINYLKKREDILKLHSEAQKHLNPGGLFIYDFTTPKHSREAATALKFTSGSIPEGASFTRHSTYDAATSIHTNCFEIRFPRKVGQKTPECHVEVHHQKAYTLRQMRTLTEETDFQILEALDGFTTGAAGANSLRITFVLQCPKTQ